MSFETASPDVADVLRGGALPDVERWLGQGMDIADIMSRLRDRYSPIGGNPYPDQVYSAIIRRAREALEQGRRLNRKRSDNPLSDDDHVGSVGVPSNYQYTVVVEFLDEATGRWFTRPFVIGSDVPLGKFTLLALARLQALNWIQSGRDTLGAGSSDDDLFIEDMYVSDALKAI